MHGPSTFPKPERLRRGVEFRRVYETGRKWVGPLMVLYVGERPPEGRPNDPAADRVIGVVTSRRLGGAVVRNRARRLLREAYRLNKHKLKTGIEMILVARVAIRGRRLAEVEAELLRLLARAGVMAAC